MHNQRLFTLTTISFFKRDKINDHINNNKYKTDVQLILFAFCEQMNRKILAPFNPLKSI